MQLEGLVMDNATLMLMKQVTQLYAAKHQPGRHNQQAHDPTKGQHATSPGARLLELMPDVPEGATWKQKMKACDKSGLKAAYDSDPELRELVDDICGYTQGYFNPIRDAGDAISNGNPEYWAKYERARRDHNGPGSEALDAFVERRMEEIFQKTHNEWRAATQAKEEAALGGVEFPSEYEKELDTFLTMRGGLSYFRRLSGEEQKADTIGTARALRSAVKLNDVIRNSEGSDVSLYRGIKIRAADEAKMLEDYPVGSEMEIGGPISFTADDSIARKFAQGGNAGGAKVERKMAGNAWVMEIQPGAKSVDVNALSPYKQHEHLTQGKFEVVDIIPGKYDWEAEYPGAQPGRIVLRQKEVPVQTLPAWAERKE